MMVMWTTMKLALLPTPGEPQQQRRHHRRHLSKIQQQHSSNSSATLYATHKAPLTPPTSTITRTILPQTRPRTQKQNKKKKTTTRPSSAQYQSKISNRHVRMILPLFDWWNAWMWRTRRELRVLQAMFKCSRRVDLGREVRRMS